MYKKEIKNLEWLKCETSDEIGKTIDTAIALMRAAEIERLREENAELRTCYKAAFELECCDTFACVRRHANQAGETIHELRAEVERLRTAIRTMRRARARYRSSRVGR